MQASVVFGRIGLSACVCICKYFIVGSVVAICLHRNFAQLAFILYIRFCSAFLAARNASVCVDLVNVLVEWPKLKYVAYFKYVYDSMELSEQQKIRAKPIFVMFAVSYMRESVCVCVFVHSWVFLVVSVIVVVGLVDVVTSTA